MAKNEATNEGKLNEAKVTGTPVEEKYYWEEPIDKDHQDPIWVSINGKTTYIQRGVRVEVSKAVYEVLLNRREMMKESLKRSKALQENSRF